MGESYHWIGAKTLDRIAIIEKVSHKLITQKEAAKQLGISTRHLRRLTQTYLTQGSSGLESQRKGKPSNNRISDEIKQNVLHLLNTQYQDFRPTLAHEKLTEHHGFHFSVEWLRTLMMDQGLWKGKKRRSARIHHTRARRSAFGELVQIDGSHHDWFEGRAQACCLLVFVDDATSAIVALHFAPQETTQAYFEACKQHITQYGRPLGYYSDKFGVFRVNHKEAQSGTGETQFGRAMRELDIDLICANSPQAKGRVERMNGTLQDRLVKEMRLRGISSIEDANRFLPEFIQSLNQRFAKTPASPIDAHREHRPDESSLDTIFSLHHQRVLSKNLEMSYNNVLYQIQMKTPSYAMRGASITVCDHAVHGVSLFYKGAPLSYTTINKDNRPAPIVPKKQLQVMPKKTKPSSDHPWRKAHHSPSSQTAPPAQHKAP